MTAGLKLSRFTASSNERIILLEFKSSSKFSRMGGVSSNVYSDARIAWLKFTAKIRLSDMSMTASGVRLINAVARAEYRPVSSLIAFRSSSSSRNSMMGLSSSVNNAPGFLIR